MYNKSSSKQKIRYIKPFFQGTQPQDQKNKAKTKQKNRYSNIIQVDLKGPNYNTNEITIKKAKKYNNINKIEDRERPYINNNDINIIKAKNVNNNNSKVEGIKWTNINKNEMKNMKAKNLNNNKIENIKSSNKNENNIKNIVVVKNLNINNKKEKRKRPSINKNEINNMKAKNLQQQQQQQQKQQQQNQQQQPQKLQLKQQQQNQQQYHQQQQQQPQQQSTTKGITNINNNNRVDEINKEKKNNERNINEEKKNKITQKEVLAKNNIINGTIFPRGLNNIGATCYMNSVLQSFYHVFDLSNELIKLKNIDERKMPMTSAYLEVINELTFSKEKSISPIKFKIMISNNELFEGIGANDAKSLTLYILETLNEEFNGNNLKINNENLLNKIRNLKNKEMENIVKTFNSQYNSIIADLFYGLKMTTYKCFTCNDCPADYQLFNIINLSIEQTFVEMKKKELKVDILECLKVEQKPKYFNGDNQLFCDKCNKMVDGESVNKIYMAPKIMILFLDRGFNNSFRCEVTFPEILKMKEFVDNDGGEYHLIGVIEHLGPSSNSGHFIATCKHFDGKWYLFSDSTIIPLESYKKNGEPYLLFYRKD